MNTPLDDFMYDNFALGDDCHKFGIWDGCKSWCPVLERGECENWEDFFDLTKEDDKEMAIEYGYIKDEGENNNGNKI